MLDDDIKSLLSDLQMGSYVKELEDLAAHKEKKEPPAVNTPLQSPHQDTVCAEVNPSRISHDRGYEKSFSQPVPKYCRPQSSYYALLTALGVGVTIGACGFSLFLQKGASPDETVYKEAPSLIAASDIPSQSYADKIPLPTKEALEDVPSQEIAEAENLDDVETFHEEEIDFVPEEPSALSQEVIVVQEASLPEDPLLAKYLSPIVQSLDQRNEVLSQIGKQISDFVAVHAAHRQELFDEECTLLFSRYRAEDIRLSAEIMKTIQCAFLEANREGNALLSQSLKNAVRAKGAYDSSHFVELKEVFEKENEFATALTNIQNASLLQELAQAAFKGSSLLNSFQDKPITKVLFDVDRHKKELIQTAESQLQRFFFDPKTHLASDTFTQENRTFLENILSTLAYDEDSSKPYLVQFDLLATFIPPAPLQSLQEQQKEVAVALPTEEEKTFRLFSFPKWLSTKLLFQKGGGVRPLSK